MADTPLYSRASKAFLQYHDRRGMSNLKSGVIYEARNAFMEGWAARHNAFHPSRDEIVEVLYELLKDNVFDTSMSKEDVVNWLSELNLTILWELFTGETNTSQMEEYHGEEPE